MADERPLDDPQDAMIRWLSGQTSDVRHSVTRLLNWDAAERVLEWIATRDDCDVATAKALFWNCDPTALVSQPDGAPTTAAARLATLICQRSAAGLYADTGLGDDIENLAPSVQRWQQALALRATPPPFTPPASFLSARKGRRPTVPTALRTEHNPELRDLLWALGTDVTPAAAPTTDRRSTLLGLLWLGIAAVFAGVAVVAGRHRSSRKQAPRPPAP